LSQTRQDFELLIVGDGCTDNTAEVVKSFSDSRIQWFDLPKAPNFGYANRNIALKSARGAYIAFMAHDDVWLSDHLEILLKAFESDQIEIAYSRPLWVTPQGMMIPGTFNLNYSRALEKFLNKERNEIPASCFVYRRECLSKYGDWNENLTIAGDMDLWVRIIEGGGRKNFVYIETPTCLHFKANWHSKWYEFTYGFKFWRKFFSKEKLLAEQLSVSIVDGVPEQKAIWNEMSLDPINWNKKIRSAVSQALDRIVNQLSMRERNLLKTMITWLIPKKLLQSFSKRIKK
jgi:glycosyltransferase involved in cell wall biosynthesis